MRFDDRLDIERALVIYAHPDDAEFGCSGTVAKWAKAGVEVVYAMLTDGSAGSSDPAMTRERLAAIRRAEQEQAAALLGVAHVEFLGYPDGFLDVGADTRKAVTRVVRRHRPDAILATDPTVRLRDGYVNHPDHVAAGELAMRAINPDASTRLMFPDLADVEGLEPHKPKALFLVHYGEEADHVEDITDTLETKVQALGCHASQLDGDWDWAGFVRERAAEIGRRIGVAAGEGFKVIRLDD